MKKLSEIKMTEDMLKRAEGCETPEALIELAKEYDVALTLEEAKALFEKRADGVLSDEMLDAIASGMFIVTGGQVNKHSK